MIKGNCGEKLVYCFKSPESDYEGQIVCLLKTVDSHFIISKITCEITLSSMDTVLQSELLLLKGLKQGKYSIIEKGTYIRKNVL